MYVCTCLFVDNNLLPDFNRPDPKIKKMSSGTLDFLIYVTNALRVLELHILETKASRRDGNDVESCLFPRRFSSLSITFVLVTFFSAFTNDH